MVVVERDGVVVVVAPVVWLVVALPQAMARRTKKERTHVLNEDMVVVAVVGLGVVVVAVAPMVWERVGGGKESVSPLCSLG
jgi:hypothetical protein